MSLDEEGELVVGDSPKQVDAALDLEESSQAPKQEDSVRAAIGNLELAPPELDNVEVSFNESNPRQATEASTFDGDVGAASYDTISAAVASVSPVDRDPASRDFDDSDVSGGGNDRGNRRLPTAEELAQSERPKPPQLDPDSEVAESAGSLEERPALAVLYDTTAGRLSGKLALSNGGVRKEIYFKRGVPEYVSSNIASELLGAYLVRMDVISSGELDMALAVMPHFGGKLGDTLVGLGLMKPLEVFRHLTRQVRSKIIEVCTWTQGRYEWFSDARCPRQAFPLDLDPLEVYGAGASAMPRDTLAVAVPELFQVQGIRKFQETLDGTRGVGEIAAQATAGDEGLHQLRLLFLLVNTKLVVTDASA